MKGRYHVGAMPSVAFCPHVPACSGCRLIGTEYARQLEGKLRAVRALFERGSLHGFDAASIRTITPSPRPLGYRNRAKLVAVRSSGHDVKLGLYRQGTHDVVDIPGCPVQTERINEAVEAVRAGLRELNISIYDEETHTGDLRYVTVRHGEATGEGLVDSVRSAAPCGRRTLDSRHPQGVTLHAGSPRTTKSISPELLIGFVTRADTFPGGDELARQVAEHCEAVVGVVQNVNPKRGNVIFGPSTHVLTGQAYFEEAVCGVRLRLGLSSFFQVNTAVAERAYQAIVANLELTKDTILVDLYCGVGSIGLVAARWAGRVVGIEESSEAIEFAQGGARLNRLGHVGFRRGRVEERWPELSAELARGGASAELVRVVVNPPRKGLGPDVCRGLLRAMPGRMAYLSCEPRTLVRDLEQLVGGGYAVRHVELFDMFPQTEQVETLAILEPDERRDYVTIRRRGRRRTQGGRPSRG